MIRIERVDLPAGLRAIAQRDREGILVIYVAEGLDARRQRAAVMEAVRASRRAGWRGVVPAGVAAFGAVRLLLRRVAVRFRTQPVATAGWAGGAAAVIAAGVAGVLALSMAAGPHRPANAFGSRPGVSVSGSARAGGRPGQSGQPGQPGGGSSGPGGSGGTSPAGGAVAPSASRTAAAPGPTSGPPGGPTSSPPGGGGSSSPPSQTPPASGSTPPVAPTTAPAPPQTPKPSPSPSSAPPGSHSKPCIHLLIIGICL
ncbi:MAG TPA: hypothetical protein VGM79_16545 [Streptosporangiaceae bacterium]